MTIPDENILSVCLNEFSTHHKLLSYLQAKKKGAPIRQLYCRLGFQKDFSIHHPLFSLIQSTPTLEHVLFDNTICKYTSIKVFLDAVSQNHSIHTVSLSGIECSAQVLAKLMDRKIRWTVYCCRLTGQHSHCNEYTCNAEALTLRTDIRDSTVTDFLSRIRAWPLLRQLYIAGCCENFHFVQNIVCGAPVLRELRTRTFHFDDPAALLSLASSICHHSSADLKWEICNCSFSTNIISTLEEIVSWEKAKLMRVTLDVKVDDDCQVLSALMIDSSCLGELEISYSYSHPYNFDIHLSQPPDCILPQMFQALQQQHFPSKYTSASVQFSFDMTCFKNCHQVIASIPHWTPRVKKRV